MTAIVLFFTMLSGSTLFYPRLCRKNLLYAKPVVSNLTTDRSAHYAVNDTAHTSDTGSNSTDSDKSSDSASKNAEQTADKSQKENKKEKANGMPALSISSPSVLLMEAETGTILYQKNEHDSRPPASVTKIMTLNLIFDAIDKKQIALTDEVTVSESAAAMGGSQVFLEAGEIQTVETLIKCISVASANDACVAYIDRRHYLLCGF